ncbi:MAG: T9SS type A sorting domain-containing protein [Bacteroidota bacterium]|nr:T9SS type A sorting domain-containing protein [Bacteroidota bacterium]
MGRIRIQTYFLLLFSATVVAQWSNNSSVNTLICSGNLDRFNKQIINDGSDGLFIVWYENGTSSTNFIYAQHVNNAGVAQWTAGGVKVYSGANSVSAPQCVLDGSGGLIVAWKNGDSSNIYAQRLNSSGLLQWTTLGTNISQDVMGIALYEPQLMSDNAGGAFILWDGPFGVVLSRFNSGGTVLWKKSITTNHGGVDTRMTSDGAGGVILVWTDNINIPNGDFGDLFAQRVNASGQSQWTSEGVVVCNTTNLQNYPHIVSDGNGGAIIAWEDFRSGSHYKVYAQKINSTGGRVWVNGSDSNGVAICTAAGSQDEAYVVSDGAGGGIFSWDDSRTSSDDIYAQRINSIGLAQWTATGTGICVQANPQANPKICSDGSGGAIVVWDDNRISGINQDIYAQRINGTGIVQWTPNGVAVSTAANNQNQPLIISSSSGGAVVVWDDYRIGGSGNTHPDFYAQKINGNGAPTVVSHGFVSESKSFLLEQNYPNPFNPATVIKYQLPTNSHVTLKVYDAIGREVATLVNGVKEAGYYSVTFDASKLSSGIYFTRLQNGDKVQLKKMVLLK